MIIVGIHFFVVFLQSQESLGDSKQAGAGADMVAINSTMSEWAEEMELDWGQVVIRDDLLALRDFLKTGIDVFVMEQKVM